jgi:hypothetical protein
LARHGDDPYMWTVNEAGKDVRLPQEGVAAEVDLYTDLEQCVDERGVWIEYGILEDRFSTRYPDKFRTLRELYGIVLLDGHRKYSVASYITSHVLSKLEALGSIEYPGITGWSEDALACVSTHADPVDVRPGLAIRITRAQLRRGR